MKITLVTRWLVGLEMVFHGFVYLFHDRVVWDNALDILNSIFEELLRPLAFVRVAQWIL